MNEFFGSVWWLLVTLGVLVTFHEFGHYWVARRFGVRVLRFSIGFGKPIWSRIGRDGVEYAIGAIPLGGYVKFLDAREAERPELVAGTPGEYNGAPVWQRMAIVLAGPVFNIVFTIVAFWAMFLVGRPDIEAVIDTPSGLAAAAGFAKGERLVGVDGEQVGSWGEAMLAIMQQAILHRDASVSTVDAQGRTQQHVLALSKLSGEVADSDKTLDQIGLAPKPIDAVIGDVPDGPAARAGLRKGDRILRVGDVRVATFGEFAKAIQDQAAKNPRLHLLVDRAGGQLDLDVVAERKDMGSGMRWYINVAPPESRVVERYGPLRAIPMALHESWKTAHSMLSVIGGMLTGQASAKNLSSVISIAQAANASAQLGLGYFLSFLAVISLSLGILNLLPIPILDGGHLLYYLIESVKGSPLNERAMIAGQYVGLAVLVTLMSIAFYNDILRQVSG